MNPFLVACAVAMAVLAPLFSAGQDNVGIWQTYIVLQVDTPANVFVAGGENADNATRFDSLTFSNLSQFPLRLIGGEIKSFKNGPGDVTGAFLNYRIVEDGGTPGGYTEIALPWVEDLPNPGDQKWQSVADSIPLFDSLPVGTHQLEVYWRISSNQGDVYDDNGGNSYTVPLTVHPVAAPKTGAQLEATLSAFPNPSNELLSLSWKLSEPAQQVEVQLFDMAGRAVFQQALSNTSGATQLDAQLAAGQYQAVLLANGTQVATTRIVVSK